MADEKKETPVIHQNGKSVRPKISALKQDEVIIHQNGREVKKRINTSLATGDHIIAQNGKARFGNKKAVTEYNQALAQESGNTESANFDSALYNRRLQEFADKEPKDLLLLHKSISVISAEDKKALLAVMHAKGITPEAEEQENGDGDDPNYDQELYDKSVTAYAAMKNDKLKELFKAKDTLTSEEADALNHVITKKGIKA